LFIIAAAFDAWVAGQAASHSMTAKESSVGVAGLIGKILGSRVASGKREMRAF
jgi:hypothetical protein